MLLTKPRTTAATIASVWNEAVPDREPPGEYRAIRYISVPISTLLLRCSVTPNGATWMMLITGLAGVGCIATGRFWLMLLGSALLIFHEVLDYVDGEMARFLNLRSAAGHFLESTSHDIVFGVLPLAVGWSLYWSGQPEPLFLVLGASAGLFGALSRNARGKLAWSIANLEDSISSETIREMCGDKRGATRHAATFGKTVLRWTRRKVLGYQEMIYFYLPLAIIAQKVDWYLYFYGVVFPAVYALKCVYLFQAAARRGRAIAEGAQPPHNNSSVRENREEVITTV